MCWSQAYLSILYLKPRMQIILRGKKNMAKLVSRSLTHIEHDVYKPHFSVSRGYYKAKLNECWYQCVCLYSDVGKWESGKWLNLAGIWKTRGTSGYSQVFGRENKNKLYSFFLLPLSWCYLAWCTQQVFPVWFNYLVVAFIYAQSSLSVRLRTAAFTAVRPLQATIISSLDTSVRKRRWRWLLAWPQSKKTTTASWCTTGTDSSKPTRKWAASWR